MTIETIPTPELDKQHEAITRGHSQEIGAFIDWLGDNGYILARALSDEDDRLVPAVISPTRLLAAYFDIDLKAIERERRALLDAIRST